MKDYHKEVQEIDNKFKHQLSVLESTKPKAPRFMTEARAQRRRALLEAQMVKLYGEGWRDREKPKVDKILMNASKNRTKHTQNFRSIFKKSEITNQYTSSIHEPIDWDQIAKNRHNNSLHKLNSAGVTGLTMPRSSSAGNILKPKLEL